MTVSRVLCVVAASEIIQHSTYQCTCPSRLETASGDGCRAGERENRGVQVSKSGATLK